MRHIRPAHLTGVAAACLVAASLTPAHAQEDSPRPAVSPSERVANAQAIEDSPFDINLTVAAMTDYVSLRGFTQTRRGPAVQATLDASYDDFHAGFFTSNVDFGTPEPDTEFDPFVAWRPSYGNWSFDVTAYYYFYLDNEALNYPEIFSTASYNFDDIATLGATFAYAPNYFGDDRETGTFYKANLSVPLPRDFSFSGSIGYQDFDKGLFDRHLVWDAGLTYTFEDTLSFDIRYHDTDLDPGRQCTGAFKCDATIVGTLSISTGLKALRKMALAD